MSISNGSNSLISTTQSLSTTIQSSLDPSGGLTTSSNLSLSYSSAPEIGTGQGLIGQYYRGTNFDTFQFEQVDPTVNFNWGNSSPDSEQVGFDDFSIRWSGKVQPKYSDTYTFYTTSDDGVRLWVDGQLLVDNWTNHPVTEDQGTITLEAGKQYDIQLEYYEHWGSATSSLMWSSPIQQKEIIPQSQLYPEAPVIGTGDGLLGQYYTGTNFDTFQFEQVDPTVNFNWGNGSPDPDRVGFDDFTVRWSGQVQAMYSDTYTFYTTSDDGVRLWVNGELLVDNWTNHAVMEDQGTITLEAGQKYNIQLEYYEHWGNATSTLLWSSSKQEKDIIPQSQLYSPSEPITPPPVTPVTPIIGTGNGLLGQYYNGSNFDQIKVEQTDATVDFTWWDAPNSKLGADNFSVRWSGKVQPKYSDTYTFYTNADDGVRLWVNGELLVDNWTDQAPAENQGTITLEAGQQYDIQLEYYERNGGATATLMWSSSHQEKEVIPQSQLYSEVKPQLVNGLRGDYFNGMNFETPALSRTDSTVDFDWGFTAPDAGVNSEHFSVRWTGLVEPEFSETYTFYTNSDDGIRLWVNGELLVDHWSNHAPTEDQGTISLEAGQKYDIRLEYFENTSGAVSQLMWSSPSQPKEIVPSSQLFSQPIPDANDRPMVTVPGEQSMPQNTQLVIPGITVADPDAGNSQVAVTLQATNGVLTVKGDVAGGVAATNIQGNGSQSVVLVGTIDQINTTLANQTGLIYKNNRGFLGTDAIAVSINDNGNTGTGGPLTDIQFFNVSVYGTNSEGTGATLGVNLNGVTDWSTQWPFVDVFRTSRPWLSQRSGADWNQGGPLNLTADGWVASLEPGQYAETIMMTGDKFPSGQYTLLYDGEGSLGFSYYDNAQIVSQEPGRMLVNVTPDNAGIFLRISETNPDNPIRNIRFIMPGFEETYETEPFHPLFLERIAKFDGLRFMDWQATNHSPLVNWSERTTPNSATQASAKGVALEYIIDLANKLKIDPWLTIPAEASDEYVWNFAAMVRDRLDPSLKARIEYSNEIWNNIFTQSSYVAAKGLEQGLDDNGFTAGLYYYSERAVEIFKIFDETFGDSRDERVVRVLSGQASNPWTGEQILAWKDAYKYADAYAIAPYFDGFGDADGDGWSDLNDPDMVNQTITLTPDQIIDNMMLEIPTEIKQMFDVNYNIATRQFGLDLLAYEGGPHLTSYQFDWDKQDSMTELFLAANNNPRMRDVYGAYLNQWEQSGGTLFNQFVDVNASSKWGFWGALEYQNQDLATAPKYGGLMDFIDSKIPTLN